VSEQEGSQAIATNKPASQPASHPPINRATQPLSQPQPQSASHRTNQPATEPISQPVPQSHTSLSCDLKQVSGNLYRHDKPASTSQPASRAATPSATRQPGASQPVSQLLGGALISLQPRPATLDMGH
jgi:hypothetical protein